MSNIVEIQIERAPYLDHLRIRALCEPHFAEGNDVRFVDADGHPILDVTKEGGWVKEYEAPPPPEPAVEESSPAVEAAPETAPDVAVEEVAPAESEVHAQAAADSADVHAEHAADASAVDEPPAAEEAPPPVDEESPR